LCTPILVGADGGGDLQDVGQAAALGQLTVLLLAVCAHVESVSWRFCALSAFRALPVRVNARVGPGGAKDAQHLTPASFPVLDRSPIPAPAGSAWRLDRRQPARASNREQGGGSVLRGR